MTVSVTGLSKRYGATLALDGVDLEIRSGEVHALLGHNGAGKSTVIRCLGGGTAPSSGEIVIDGTSFSALEPRDSIAQGIAVIYQHLSLVGSLTVAENLFLGQELATANIVLHRREQRRLAVDALRRVGSEVSPDTLVGELPIGQRQLVEIAKALRRDAKLLILDEPSAALSPIEAERLAALVSQLREEGIAILYVTHLLGEVMRLADRATVLRNGQVVWTSGEKGFTKAELVGAISDVADAQHAAATIPFDEDAEPRLVLDQVRATGLDDISLSVRPGEIVCLYGLIGSGRTRLLETLFGTRRFDAGRISIDGKPIDYANPAGAIRSGVALVPADRATQGLFGSLSAMENTVTKVISRLAKGPLRSFRGEREVFSRIATAMGLRPMAPDLAASRFSGGNQQKILISRWVNDKSRVSVLLLDDPTQGVDVGARAEIYHVIRTLAAERQLAVIFNTNEPEEALALAHRIVVMHRGALVSEIVAAETDEEHLLDLIHHDARKDES